MVTSDLVPPRKRIIQIHALGGAQLIVDNCCCVGFHKY
jgi:hypothetical protein